MIDVTLVVELRTRAGLSQRALAKRTGVNAMTIHRLEHGADPSDLPLRILGRLADALRVEPAALLHSRSTGPEPAPAADPAAAPPPLDDRPLDHNAARLLRRIHRGQDIRRTMTRTERELTLPQLINRGLAYITPDGATLTAPVGASLDPTPDRPPR